MSELKKAIESMINCFSNYAAKSGDKHTLNKAELKDLLQSELKELVSETNDKARLDKFFKELDMNSDGQVDFVEFGTMVLSLAAICHDYFKKTE